MGAMTVKDWLEVARATIEGVEYCFLITESESGEANARLMQPFKPDEDLTIWFGASPRSRKVREIKAHDRVTVAYEHPEEGAYVTLLGRAVLERDVELRGKYWRRRWVRYWPEGPESDDYVLIKFMPERLELMSEAREVAPDPIMQPGVLVREGDEWVVAGGED
jgi:general stress protein 26